MTTKDITLIANFADKHEINAEVIFNLLALGTAHMMELTLNKGLTGMHDNMCDMYYDIYNITTQLREENENGQSSF